MTKRILRIWLACGVVVALGVTGCSGDMEPEVDGGSLRLQLDLGNGPRIDISGQSSKSVDTIDPEAPV